MDLSELGIKPVNHGGCCGPQEWLGGGIVFGSINPTTEKVLAEVESVNQEGYERIIHSAQETFLKWRTVPAPKRGMLIRELGLLLRKHKQQLGMLITLEMGKSKSEGEGEVQEMIDMADLAVGQARMLYGTTMHSERFEHRMYEQWHPLGPVGVISAFNFPMAVWAWNAFLAVICGNPVIWKPSSKVPLCAIAVQHLCNQVMAEHNCPGIFSLFIPQDHKLAEALVDNSAIPLISFTGSTKVGRQVAQQMAKRLGRSILELGGNNAIIIDSTADLKLAIPSVLFGALGTAGQRCTTTRRVIIHADIYAQVVTELCRIYKQVKIGDPLEAKNLMGPLVDESAVENYLHTIQTITAEGGRILCGGARLSRPGYFVTPCLAEVEPHWPIVQQETFAPILYLIRYKDLTEALHIHNQVPQGLSSAIFTRDLQHAEYFLSTRGSDCGIANVNIGTSGAEIGGAFGGEKDTGGGREAGSDAWKSYMRRQTNTINWSKELPLAQGITFNVE